MKIDITLSADSFLKAADELRKYADSLQGKSETLVQKLGDKGVEQANLYLEHDDTGETRNSIQFHREGDKGTVSVGGAAVWIEFGTGVIRNSGSGHPKKGDLGMSDWGTYGEGHGSDPNGWYFPSHYYGWTITKGIQMNPFMYSAAQDMRMDLLDTAKEVFRSD